MLKRKEFCGTSPLFGKSVTAAEALEAWVNEQKIARQDIISINRDYDGCATLWYWEVDWEQVKRAVAQVCLKPGDPLDPNGVLNE